MKTRDRLDIRLDRYEFKYLIPSSLVPKIREYIRPFCRADAFTRGDPPEYVTTTLQLDTPDLSMHRAKINEANGRFKLRVRTYGEPGESPVFMEVKRKFGKTIVKTRAKIPFERWGAHLMTDTRLNLTFKSLDEENGYLDFVRLVRQTGARPVVLVRYTREPYSGVNEPYARVTFDRKLFYQPTASWDSWGRGGYWRCMDTPFAQNKNYPFSSTILEIKTLSDAPQWMMDLIVDFNLEATGNCKYSSAIWQESLFDQMSFAPYTSEDVLHP
jgi:SPX domain protein involved in polyphosphate accumulation